MMGNTLAGSDKYSFWNFLWLKSHGEFASKIY